MIVEALEQIPAVLSGSDLNLPLVSCDLGQFCTCQGLFLEDGMSLDCSASLNYLICVSTETTVWVDRNVTNC